MMQPSTRLHLRLVLADLNCPALSHDHSIIPEFSVGPHSSLSLLLPAYGPPDLCVPLKLEQQVHGLVLSRASSIRIVDRRILNSHPAITTATMTGFFIRVRASDVDISTEVLWKTAFTVTEWT